MNCSECRELWDAFHQANTRYHEALRSPFYKISTQFAAYEFIKMQRTKNDLEEHHFECPWANLVDNLLGTDGMAHFRRAVGAGNC
jgi:hypothetical protein